MWFSLILDPWSDVSVIVVIFCNQVKMQKSWLKVVWWNLVISTVLDKTQGELHIHRVLPLVLTLAEGQTYFCECGYIWKSVLIIADLGSVKAPECWGTAYLSINWYVIGSSFWSLQDIVYFRSFVFCTTEKKGMTLTMVTSNVSVFFGWVLLESSIY